MRARDPGFSPGPATSLPSTPGLSSPCRPLLGGVVYEMPFSLWAWSGSWYLWDRRGRGPGLPWSGDREAWWLRTSLMKPLLSGWVNS